MAKLVRIYENGIEQTILTFRGQTFTLTMGRWEEGGLITSKEKDLSIQIEDAFGDDENIDEIVTVVDELTYESFDTCEKLEELESFE